MKFVLEFSFVYFLTITIFEPVNASYRVHTFGSERENKVLEKALNVKFQCKYLYNFHPVEIIFVFSYPLLYNSKITPFIMKTGSLNFIRFSFILYRL